MKKGIILMAVLLFIGCGSATLHQGIEGGDAAGKTVTAEHLATLPAAMMEGFEDQTDYGKGFEVDQLASMEQTVRAAAPLAALGGPVGGAVIGVMLTALGMVRRHRAAIKPLVEDARGFVELVKGINDTTNGTRVRVISETLANNLKIATSEGTKARIKRLTRGEMT